MPRSVNSVAAKARRKKVLKLAKGYFGRRKNVHTVAKNAVDKGLQYAYRDRRQKKRNFRALWIQRINAACRARGITYSRFMEGLKSIDVDLDRKIMSDVAIHDEAAFDSLVSKAKEAIEKKRAVS